MQQEPASQATLPTTLHGGESGESSGRANTLMSALQQPQSMGEPIAAPMRVGPAANTAKPQQLDTITGCTSATVQPVNSAQDSASVSTASEGAVAPQTPAAFTAGDVGMGDTTTHLAASVAADTAIGTAVADANVTTPYLPDGSGASPTSEDTCTADWASDDAAGAAVPTQPVARAAADFTAVGGTVRGHIEQEPTEAPEACDVQPEASWVADKTQWQPLHIEAQGADFVAFSDSPPTSGAQPQQQDQQQQQQQQSRADVDTGRPRAHDAHPQSYSAGIPDSKGSFSSTRGRLGGAASTAAASAPVQAAHIADEGMPGSGTAEVPLPSDAVAVGADQGLVQSAPVLASSPSGATADVEHQQPADGADEQPVEALDDARPAPAGQCIGALGTAAHRHCSPALAVRACCTVGQSSRTTAMAAGGRWHPAGSGWWR
jgi:hypothetical protein